MEPIDLSRLLPPSGRFSGNPYSTPQSARSIVTPISVASALSIGNLSDIGDDNFKKPLIKPQGKGYKQEFNTYIIEWNDNLPDPDNPIHWHANKKFYIGVTLLSMTFITLLNGSYLNPSIVDSDSDLKNNHIGLFFSAIFGLGAAISPLLLGPLSEIYGRIWVLRIGLFVFTFFNLMCVFSQTKGIIILLRFIAGFGAGAPLSVTQAIFSDIFTKEERKRFMAINSLSSILAPTAGSIIGGFVGAYSTWRAVYWTTAVITVMHQALSFLVLVETYTPILIERKAEQLRLKLAESGETNFEVATSFDKKEHVYKLGKITTKSLLRSVRLYFTEPILVLLTFHYLVIYSLYYMAISALRALNPIESRRSLTVSQGFSYFSILCGACMASMVATRRLGQLCSYLGIIKGDIDSPEYKFRCTFPGVGVLLPIGFLLFGLTCTMRMQLGYLLLFNLGAFIIGFGMITAARSCSSYVLKIYHIHAASASAAVAFPRRALAFIIAISGSRIIRKVGLEKVTIALLGSSFLISCPSAILLWIFGSKLRKAGTYNKAS